MLKTETIRTGRALGNLGFPLAEILKPMGFKDPELVEGDVRLVSVAP
jgi:hypothetical protein